ncbi:MAG: 1-acyl-sn-glycerol-3-phosphate acyltransferase [Nitriliruptorales bacterium]|nr:1-acyl-sn-glycerol-3-phosphate acyltransferase [Nitriliruptorales bacterium]
MRLVFRIRIVGAEHLPRWGPALVAANHVSLLDPPAVFTLLYRAGRRARFLAVSDLWRITVLGWLLRRGRMIPVERGQGPDRMVRHACAALEAGQVVVIYPEGHVAPPELPLGRTGPGKPGAGMLALRTSAPVVPVAILGLRRRNPRWWRLPPRDITIVVGRPVDLSGLRGRLDPEAALGASEAMLAEIRALMASRATPGRNRPRRRPRRSPPPR